MKIIIKRLLLLSLILILLGSVLVSATSSDIKFKSKSYEKIDNNLKSSEGVSGSASGTLTKTTKKTSSTSKSNSVINNGGSSNYKPFGFVSRTNPLGRVFVLIGGFFDFSMLKQNPVLVSGFLRFLFFVLLMAVFRKGLMMVKFLENDNKTISIIAGILSLIAVFMMPESWLMMNGGIIAVIAGLILPIGLTVAVIYFSYNTISEHEEDMGRHFIALILILVAMSILFIIGNVTGLAMIFFIPKKVIKRWVK